MRHQDQCIPPNAFSPEYLAEVRDRDESLTAAEAEFAGPWKLEPLPGHPGAPGAVAVLRESESLAEGDEPEAVWLDDERGVICTVVLPLIEREPVFYLDEEADPNGPLPGGYPVIVVHGEEGPQARGWLRRYNPELVRALNTVEALNRAPAAHAAVLDAGGGGAIEKVGRALAARRR